jgi:hypothetical protein
MPPSVHVCYRWLWLSRPYLAVVAERIFIGDPRGEISAMAQPGPDSRPGRKPCQSTARSWGTLPMVMDVGARPCRGLLISVPCHEANLIRNLQYYFEVTGCMVMFHYIISFISNHLTVNTHCI